MFKKILGAATGILAKNLEDSPHRNFGSGHSRAMKRLDAMRWVKANPGKKPSEAPRHIRENAGL